MITKIFIDEWTPPELSRCRCVEIPIGSFTKKEVKKLRPYLEIKVVKAKKEKERQLGGIRIGDKYYEVSTKGKGIPYFKEFNKGNWVNGENLDKIKFPCFCRFDANKGIYGESGKTYKVNGIGIVNKNYYEGQRHYELSWADRQFKEEHGILANLSVLCGTPSLKTLIEIYDIHILKGKIIIYEEEK